MEIDCNGHLWLVDGVTATIYEVETEETEVCAFNEIPWLSENPTEGTVSFGAAFRSSARSMRRVSRPGYGRDSS